MTAFPSGAGNNVSTAHLDSAQDQPKNARTDLLDAINKINSIINSFNANDGICGLTSGGKVDSAKLIGQVDTAQLVADAVDGTKIGDNSIDSEHIVGGSVDKVHTSFISQATIDGTANNDVVPTQLAVKTFVDTAVATAVDDVNKIAKYTFTDQTNFNPPNGGTQTLALTEASDQFNLATVSNDTIVIGGGAGIYAVSLYARVCQSASGSYGANSSHLTYNFLIDGVTLLSDDHDGTTSFRTMVSTSYVDLNDNDVIKLEVVSGGARTENSRGSIQDSHIIIQKLL
jgi:hypothetical protein